MSHKVTFQAGARWLNGLTVETQARQFRLQQDEPPEMGGQDQGPSPVEVLLQALAGCLGVVTAMVANRGGFRIEGMRIEVEGDLDLEGFKGANGGRSGLTEVRVQVHLDSPEPRERLEALLRAVERACPVSDSLRQPVPVVVKLGD
ncbi:MAG: OsmC family protein [Firmicutes bacterium]|nr:OsmC family protein [Bacillota bacterium]MCL5039539.1 OsmC family protein [Bacillota bacterium]